MSNESFDLVECSLIYQNHGGRCRGFDALERACLPTRVALSKVNDRKSDYPSHWTLDDTAI
jgi:hypothetical protein